MYGYAVIQDPSVSRLSKPLCVDLGQDSENAPPKKCCILFHRSLPLRALYRPRRTASATNSSTGCGSARALRRAAEWSRTPASSPRLQSWLGRAIRGRIEPNEPGLNKGLV